MAQRHRLVNKKRKKFQSAAAAATGAAVLVLSSPITPAQAAPATDTDWAAIAACESGNQNIKNPTSSASGYFQIIDSTWQDNGGTTAHAMDASYEEQLRVANNIYENSGETFSAWAASQHCWDGKTGIAPASPVAPAPLPATPQVITGATYTVVSGDNLYKIATAAGKDWHALADLNGIAAPYILHPGQVIKLEADQAAPPPPVQTDTYTVEQGDWLSTIVANPADWTTLYDKNKDVIGENPDLIFPGEVLFVDGLLLRNKPVETTAPPVTVTTGEVVNPVPGGKITSGYGPRGGEFHNGIDIDQVKGAPILAAKAGQVIAARCGIQGFECWVRIRDLDGLVHTYGHMNNVNMIHVVEGQWVEAGTHIADVGNGGVVSSGSGDGSHLHYRLTWGEANDALPVNPETWLADHGVTIPHA